MKQRSCEINAEKFAAWILDDYQCGNLGVRIVDRFRDVVETGCTPLPNLSPSVSRCAFLLLKMTHRWRNFCTSGCCRRSLPFRWWPVGLKRNVMLQTSRTI